MIDGVVWKLRDPRVGRTLTEGVAPADDAPGRRARSSRSRFAALAAAAVALIGLAGLDQWRYHLALRVSDPTALAAAARVNPYDAAVQARLVRALTERGDEAALRAHFEANLARDPADVDTLVNAGVLARQQGRHSDAERHWTDAMAHDPGLTHVRLYLAGLFDEQGRADDTARCYRRWLERVVARAGSATPEPAAVVAVVLRFGDALARGGHAAEARTQFELAEKMATRARLADLAAAARERLGPDPIPARP